MKTALKEVRLPDSETVRQELQRQRRRYDYFIAFRNIMCVILSVAAVAVIVSVFIFPALQVCGTSMEPSLETGEIVIAVKQFTPERGDIIAFYYNNKMLLKRVIGLPGDEIQIDSDGSVYVNGTLLSESYISSLCLGECDVKFPYMVPEGRYFVLGDNRAVSLDSRFTSVGCVAEENIAGKLLVRVWPPDTIGRIE